jgi:hypothetical protein
MTNKTEGEDNIEMGRREISRRVNLSVASLGLILPYYLLVIWPAYHYFGKYVALPFFLPFVVFQAWVYIWVARTLCPRCGKPIGGKTYRWKCKSCGLEINAPKWFGQRISFTKIPYIPGPTKNRNDLS